MNKALIESLRRLASLGGSIALNSEAGSRLLDLAESAIPDEPEVVLAAQQQRDKEPGVRWLSSQDLDAIIESVEPPDLDPEEEVRRAIDEWSWDGGTIRVLCNAAREWLHLREQPAPDVRPKWCNVHQHHKWCEHNGGVMGPTGYAAPDVQAQERWDAIIREREALAEEVRQMVAAVEQMADVQAQIDAAYERGVADGLRKARS